MQGTATVAVINSNNNKLLILRRGPTAPWMPGRYCLPGGHAEGNEGLTYCASRELSEEVSISYPVDELKPITINYKYYSKIIFLAIVNSDRVILNWEHDDYQWIDAKESELYDLVPGLETTIKTISDLGYLI